MGVQFNDISDKCSAHFDEVSQMVLRVQNGFIKTVVNAVYQDGKDLFLLKNRNDFT
jgi:hypothetical protein